ncbi:MAG: D-alanine--D-alanine ligase [Nitrospira bacterium SG8_35_4]|nr:MAG: D-alanine--D-alanine ligase [Nitrospira bacterium SG8_35_4]
MTKGPITKKRIGVLMGGLSSERDVSIRSGLAVYQGLQERGYNAVAIDVDRDVVTVLKKEKVKCAFLALHGGTGENGAMQGMLEVLGIPYTGSGVMASALAMDKEMSKKIFLYHGLPVAPFIVVKRPGGTKKRGTKDAQTDEGPDMTGAYTFPAVSRPPFDLPWVVKPVAEGSSIGVSIIKEEAELHSCLEKTFSLGERVIVEQFIQGKELHVGILGDRALGGVEVRPKLEFYNYEAKYTSGMTDYIMPPEVDETTFDNVKTMALRAHRTLGCSGLSRVDFIVDQNNGPHILEVNTLPGMTTTSLLPKIAKAAGLDFNELIEEIIRIAFKE